MRLVLVRAKRACGPRSSWRCASLVVAAHTMSARRAASRASKGGSKEQDEASLARETTATRLYGETSGDDLGYVSINDQFHMDGRCVQAGC